MNTKSYLILVITGIILISGVRAQTPEAIGDTLFAFDVGSLTPTPDRHIVGIQYAGGYLWATGFDPDDYWQHKLYKIESDGSALVATFSYGIEAAGWKDMAYDGDYLYVADIDTVRQIDMTNGQKTGVKIPAPFYYTAGLAYNPFNDHFYITGDGGSNIYEIDRDGEIVAAIANNPEHATVGLAVDTLSPGGPFLWTWSNEEVGYGLQLKASQISLQTGQFTGVEFDGISISNIIAETAGGATIAYDLFTDTTALIVINLRNGNSQDQMEWAVFYDISNDQVPGPQISVQPEAIQNTLPPGDSVDIDVTVFNNGTEPLDWTAYVETPEMDTAMNPGDTLFSFNATLKVPDGNTRINGITWLDEHIWLNGRKSGSMQSKIYKLDKFGEPVAAWPYYAINNSGYFSIASDGEYLYADDTYAIIQIDPDSFSAVGFIEKPSGSYSGFTYDPQKDHFWLGNSNGLIYEINRDGDEINEFITPLEIEGLAWDNWSPGGPYLWAWVNQGSAVGSKCRAIMLDPATCTPAGESFTGVSMSSNPGFLDEPLGAAITPGWQEGKLVFFGLQNSYYIGNGDTIPNADQVVIYDLDMPVPPEWIELLPPTYGEVGPGDSGNFTVRLRSLMEDTVMTAIIRINSNDILQPEVVIPVNFEMLPFIFTSSSETVELISSVSNSPNPFRDRTDLTFSLGSPAVVELNVLDMSGRILKRVINSKMDGGTHSIGIDGSGLPSGIYFYTLKAGGEVVVGKVIRN